MKIESGEKNPTMPSVIEIAINVPRIPGMSEQELQALADQVREELKRRKG
jgi:hypothetical protein